jgi:hypothetical protein
MEEWSVGVMKICSALLSSLLSFLTSALFALRPVLFKFDDYKK